MFSVEPIDDSHWPKLVLITSVRLLLTMYCAERSTPSVLPVDAETTNLTLAPFATPPDHSQSRSASPSSSDPRSPGSVPFTMTCAMVLESPIVLRKVVQFELAGWVRATIPMVRPVPSYPAL